NLTIFLTTHYMEEAENCDRIAIIDHGSIVALDKPETLKDRVGGDLVSLTTENNDAASVELKERYQLSPEIHDGVVTICVPHGEAFIPELVRSFNTRLLSISVRRPTLDDVFVKLTGRGIRDNASSSLEQMRMMMRGSR
ncbi:MAG: ABC transporter ATP-binding protein, partial [Dehalococcoidia bacterium]|nr:ABC transporter ATP-binding protein [Dehalococcoidia bacterium]